MQGEGTIWTPDEARLFEEKLSEVEPNEPGRWHKIAAGVISIQLHAHRRPSNRLRVCL